MGEDEFLSLRLKGRALRLGDSCIISSAEHYCLVGAAEARHRLHQRVEHRFEIDRRAADDLEHVSGCGLLL